MQISLNKNMAVLCFMAVFFIPCSLASGLDFRLPVRAGENEQHVLTLERFQLKVNGEERVIKDVLERTRTVGGLTDLGKNYILSFHAGEFNSQIEEGISYFISEILQPHDALILMTPIKVYSIAVSTNKTKIIMDVGKLLSEDYELYEKDKKSLEINLETELRMIHKNVDSYMQTHDDGVTIYKRVAQFLNNYGEIYTSYRDRYLIPSLQTNLSLGELLGDREGERWWIHFHHRGNVRLIKKITDVASMLHEYIDELGDFEPILGRTMKFHLTNFEKEIDLSGAFDYKKLLTELLLENISYLTVFWGHQGSEGTQSQGKIIPDLRDAFQEIGRATGGKTIISMEPEDGLLDLKDYTDRFYELVFEMEDDPKDMRIDIVASETPVSLSYRESFSEEEMEAWMRRMTGEKVTISDFSLKRKRVATFTLSGFETDKINRIGMMKVRLSLLGEGDQLVYTTSNILRASESEVELSVPLPKEHSGEFTLVVDVIDMMANKMDSISNRIKI